MSASEVWARCEAATNSHGYIVAKAAAGVPLDTLRVVPAGDSLRIAGQRMAGALMVPAYALDGHLQSAQFIPAPGAGKKLNLPGEIGGATFTVGPADGPAYLCEGIGAAWSCWQATGKRAVVCFGWSNVRRVAEAMRQRDTNARLVLVPDVGKESDADKIATEFGSAVARMPEGWPDNSDVNDLALRDGLNALQTLLEAATLLGLGQNIVSLDSLEDSFEPLPHVVQKWIPLGQVTLLAGHGGGGKSYVALIIAIMVCLGLPFGSLATTQSRVLFFSAEDDKRVLRQRVAKICRALAIDPAELKGRLYLLDASDIDPALHREQRVTVAGRAMIATETPLLDALSDLVKGLDVGLVIVDNASDTYDDDEIKRARVRSFVRSLRQRIAQPDRAVLLLAHINKDSAKAGKNAGSEDYSGSTAWHNSVRSRLSLIPTGNGALTLEHAKANLGPKADPVQLEWNDGVPMISGSFSTTGAKLAESIIREAASAQDEVDKAALVGLIQGFDKLGERVTTSSQGSATVFKLLKGSTGFPKAINPDRLMRLLRDLQGDGSILRRTVKTPDRKWREVFTCVPEPTSAPIQEVDPAQAQEPPEASCAD
jgi:hypothetical protein